MHLTTKQLHILSTVIKGNPDGSFIDLDQLLERLPYETTKQSIQFSIRALIAKKLLMKHPREKRRGRSRVILSATDLGYRIMSPHSAIIDESERLLHSRGVG